MASHYLSINRGVQGVADSDFTYGTSSASTDDIELRTLDGSGLTVKDVILALEAFERFLLSDNTHIAGAHAMPTA